MKTLLNRIAVREPYFALKDLVLMGPGSITARTPREVIDHGEAQQMNAAEVGRHLAILGSLSCAQLQKSDDKHYYLAVEADLKREDYDAVMVMAEYESGIARAQGCLLDKRNSSAHCTLAFGDDIWTLDVKYKVIPERIFEKIYHNR